MLIAWSNDANARSKNILWPGQQEWSWNSPCIQWWNNKLHQTEGWEEAGYADNHHDEIGDNRRKHPHTHKKSKIKGNYLFFNVYRKKLTEIMGNMHALKAIKFSLRTHIIRYKCCSVAHCVRRLLSKETTFWLIRSICRFCDSISLPMSTAIFRRFPIMPDTSHMFCSISSSRASFNTLQAHKVARRLIKI